MVRIRKGRLEIRSIELVKREKRRQKKESRERIKETKT